MHITILAVGKVKERFYRQAVDEFKKRLGRYCRLDIIEVQDEKTPDKAGEALECQIKEKEAMRLLKHIKETDYVITLEIDGEQPDSAVLSRKLGRLGIDGTSSITFVIGGSLGLHEAVTKRSDYKLSFSNMTFPHQLMRVILLEQIYRSYRIMNGEPYHK
ncbi:23S rRNA (pseudouridine(1915)-N(3))-methyltransferase RlmH [Dorea sp. D27]|uniref:23S rRNA (pseudouridine(1915)-N(3))-methyltransferase RlmH n=1 Tax=Dorea sp. D27 TaxID=658665 RepID=UPI00067319F6